MKTKRTDHAMEQMTRLYNRILALGGTIPPPEPWAIIAKHGHKIRVDAALRNLQLLELVEKLEKHHETNKSLQPA